MKDEYMTDVSDEVRKKVNKVAHDTVKAYMGDPRDKNGMLVKAAVTGSLVGTVNSFVASYRSMPEYRGKTAQEIESYMLAGFTVAIRQGLRNWRKEDEQFDAKGGSA